MLNHLQFASIALPPFTWIVLHAAAFRGAKNMIGFTLFKTIIPLLNTALILIAFYSNSSITPVQGFTITVFIVSIGYFIVWNKFQSINEIDAGTQIEWRDLIKQSLPMMITGSVFFILNWVDNLVIGIYRTETELGIYDTAFKISSASAAILMAVNAIQAPTFAEIHSQKDHQRLRKYVYNSTRLLFYATAPLTILLLIFPEWILSLFGKDFTPGAYPLQILAIGNFINCITGSVGILLMMTGYQLQYNRIIITAAAIGIGLNFLLVPILGIEGAAYSSTISKIIWDSFQSICPGSRDQHQPQQLNSTSKRNRKTNNENYPTKFFCCRCCKGRNNIIVSLSGTTSSGIYESCERTKSLFI
jgi:O-antigen/teichoic acid export membrane protein